MDLRGYLSVSDRRKGVEDNIGVSLKNIGNYSINEEIASSRNCENMIGVTQIPIGIAGPLKIKSEFETLFIGIKKSDTELKHAIEQRSKKQITGLLKEAELLLKIHVPKKRIRELGFEYRLGLEFLTRKKSLPTSLLQREEFPHLEKRGAGRFNDLIMDLSKENWRYTRRQMTWFKRNKQIQWIQKNDKALYIMKKFLGENK